MWILPPATEGTLGVSAARKVELSDAFDDKTLFVLTPLGGDKYWIQTAKLRIGGEAYCLAVKGTTVQAVGCDAGAGNQQFRFRKTGETDGKPEYTIRTGTDTYIIVTDQGGVEAAQIGEGTPDIDTPFLLPDKGKATLPSLD